MTPDEAARIWRATFLAMADWEARGAEFGAREAFERAWAAAIAAVNPTEPPTARERDDCWLRWLKAGKAV